SSLPQITSGEDDKDEDANEDENEKDEDFEEHEEPCEVFDSDDETDEHDKCRRENLMFLDNIEAGLRGYKAHYPNYHNYQPGLEIIVVVWIVGLVSTLPQLSPNLVDN